MKIALVNPDLPTQLPKLATAGSVGFDVYAVTKKVVPVYRAIDGVFKGGYTEYDTNLAFELPEGITAFLIPRSSSRDKSQFLANAVGLPDRDYRGGLKFSFKPDGRHAHQANEYQEGDCIGQLVFLLSAQVDFEQVDFSELSQTERGDGGHGSTDQKPVYPLASSDEQVAQNEAARTSEADQGEEPVTSENSAEGEPEIKEKELDASEPVGTAASGDETLVSAPEKTKAPRGERKAAKVKAPAPSEADSDVQD